MREMTNEEVREKLVAYANAINVDPALEARIAALHEGFMFQVLTDLGLVVERGEEVLAHVSANTMADFGLLTLRRSMVEILALRDELAALRGESRD